MSAAAGGRSAVSSQVSNHASLADFFSSSAGQPFIHSDIEGVHSTQRSQRHFQNFSVFSFGAIVPPSSLHFSYEVGADECSIWGIIAAASHGLRAKTSQRANEVRCPNGVNRVVLTLRRLLPVFPDKQTFSAGPR